MSTTQATLHQMDEEEKELLELPLMIRMSVITLVSLLLGWASERWIPFAIVPWVFYAISYLNGSFYSIQAAWEAFREGRLDVNVLMVVAALGAALIGQPLEGATLLFLFSLSNVLQIYAMGKTYTSIRALIAVTPKTARTVVTSPSVPPVEGQGDGPQEMQDSAGEAEQEVPVEQAVVGTIVRVRPGERIPCDGEVIRGSSSVNEASITGESFPVEKQPGSRVFAGTMNVQGSLDLRVTNTITDSTLARIVQIVREAREQKAQSQHFTDHIIGKYYTYAVVSVTILAMVIPLVFLKWDVATTVYRAIALMVSASPCALIISIPAAILSALASASWNGVLFKGGRSLESAARVAVLAFDKTGTLTTGQPRVTAVIPFADPIPIHPWPESFQLDRSSPYHREQQQLLAVVAAIEQYSEHPLAQAIVAEAKTYRLPLPEISDFQALAGYGVQAKWNGHLVQVGRSSLFEPIGQQTIAPTNARLITEREEQGHTVILVGTPQHVWGAIALSDTIRPESATIVASLKQIGIQRVVLLTGDHHKVAESLGKALGVDEVRARLTPEQKVEAIRQLQTAYGPVAMVGDGINDAPALAAATVGVAMGGAGTDVAMESADVVLMKDDLSRLPGMLRLARRTRRIIQQNLIVSIAVMVFLVGCSLVGVLPLPLAMIVHEGSTLLVIANGLRLLVPGISK